MSEWKSVIGLEGYYSVSNAGQIKNDRTGKIRKPSGRYLGVDAWVNGVVTYLKIHQEVARSFIGPCPVGLQVAHKDGNCHNNHVSNLEYATPKENISHKVDHGTSLRGEQLPSAKLNEKKVSIIKDRINKLESYTAIAMDYNVNVTTIRSIAIGKTWTWVNPQIIQRLIRVSGLGLEQDAV